MELDFSERWLFGRLASEAIHPTGAARPLALPIAPAKECDDIDATEDRGIDAVDGVQTSLLPLADGCGRRARNLRHLAHVVRPEPFYASRGMSPVCQCLAPQPLDEGANVFDTPRGRLGTNLDRPGEASFADALPPCALADGDRATRRENGPKADEATFWKVLEI
jgi:hypothetical protein